MENNIGLLDICSVSKNCEHTWKHIANRPTMFPGETKAQRIEWCVKCGGLAIIDPCGEKNIYIPSN